VRTCSQRELGQGVRRRGLLKACSCTPFMRSSSTECPGRLLPKNAFDQVRGRRNLEPSFSVFTLGIAGHVRTDGAGTAARLRVGFGQCQIRCYAAGVQPGEGGLSPAGLRLVR